MQFNEDIDRPLYLYDDDANILKLGKHLATTSDRNLLILNCKHSSEGIRKLCSIRMTDPRPINPDYIEMYEEFLEPFIQRRL